jgi:polysaccharide export outer membrane protein
MLPRLLAVGLSACTSAGLAPELPRGTAAYSSLAATGPQLATGAYRIGALDALDVTVFQEPELSAKGLEVDAAGMITLPLVGSLTAAGQTAVELSASIAARLSTRYLVDPNVSVAVATSASQKVAIEGEVVQPGVYDIKGGTTLLGALALARGETRVASLREVVVFRTVGGTRMGAVFDIAAIRSGRADDPRLVGNDMAGQARFRTHLTVARQAEHFAQLYHDVAA